MYINHLAVYLPFNELFSIHIFCVFCEQIFRTNSIVKTVNVNDRAEMFIYKSI